MARPSRWHGEPFKGKRTETRRNGVKYIYEQLYQYDPVEKKTKVVDSKLIGKIMPGTDQIVRTRPKKSAKTALKRNRRRSVTKAISPVHTAAADSTANTKAYITTQINIAANPTVNKNTLEDANIATNDTASLNVNLAANKATNEIAPLPAITTANHNDNDNTSLEVNSTPNRDDNEIAPLPANSTANKDGNEIATTVDPVNIRSKTRASRMHVGTCDILEWAAKESGIGEDVKCSLPEGEALKALSLANYLCATGNTLPGFESWQLTHPIPYADGISEETYVRLFSDIGSNESWVQNYFERRALRLSPNPALALDSTSVSTYSQELKEARYSYSQENDGLPVVKLCMLYSVKDCQPIAYADKPGNIPDVITLTSSLKQLESLGIDKAMIVTDCGYASASNIDEFCKNHVKFLTLVKRTVSYAKEAVDELLPRLGEFSTIYPDDPTVYGASIEKEFMKRHLYIGVYLNTQIQKKEKDRLYADILATKEKWESGERDFSTRKKFFDTYFTVSTMGRGGQEKLLVNEDAFNKAVKYMGVFVLVSNKSMDAFEMLGTYRLREKCEEDFSQMRGYLDGAKPRVQDDDTLRGRQFVQFIALGLRSFLLKKIKGVKDSLMTNDEKYIREEETLRRKLLNWLRNKSELQILQWFDCTEETTVRNKRGQWRWCSETVQRNELFLEMLGVKV